MIFDTHLQRGVKNHITGGLNLNISELLFPNLYFRLLPFMYLNKNVNNNRSHLFAFHIRKAVNLS